MKFLTIHPNQIFSAFAFAEADFFCDSLVYSHGHYVHLQKTNTMLIEIILGIGKCKNILQSL